MIANHKVGLVRVLFEHKEGIKAPSLRVFVHEMYPVSAAFAPRAIALDQHVIDANLRLVLHRIAPNLLLTCTRLLHAKNPFRTPNRIYEHPKTQFHIIPIGIKNKIPELCHGVKQKLFGLFSGARAQA
jgi:hypothetical protein